MSISIKITLFTFIFISGTATSLILFAYTSAKKELELTVGRQLEAVASTGALMIDGDLHQAVRGAEDANSKAFLSLRETLRTIKKVNNINTPLYTFKRLGNSVRFVVMTPEEHYIDHSYELRKEMIPTFEEGKSSHTSIYGDEYGSWISAYAPIYNSQQEIVGILDVDMKLETFQAELRQKTRLLIIISLIILIASSLISYFFGKSIASKLVYLSEITEEISLGSVDHPISLKSNDEVGILASSLERMRKSLKMAIEMLGDKE